MEYLGRFLQPIKGRIFLVGALKGGASLIDLIIPAALGVMISAGVEQNNLAVVYQMLAAMLVLTVLSIVLHAVAHYFSSLFSQQLGETLRDKTFAKIQRLSPTALANYDRPTLITRVTNDTENIQNAMNMCSRPLVRGMIMIVGGVGFSLVIDVGLTIPIFCGMIVVTIVSTMVFKITRPLFRKVQRSVDRLALILRENIEGIRFIKAMNKADDQLLRFKTPVLKVKKNEKIAGRTQGFTQPMIHWLANIVLVFVIFVGEIRFEQGGVSVGDVFTITNYVSMIMMASNMMPRVIAILSRANISAERIGLVLDDSGVMQYGTDILADNNQDIPELEFKNVTFTYPNAKTPSLENISFKLQKGQTLGIIGDTGSGKTTLIALILRFYDPQKGVVLFRGKSVASYKKDVLRKEITAALQQFDMFAGELEDNICLDKKFDSIVFEKATQTAQLQSLLNEKTSKEREVTQRGTNLSGGQKQRISVARALYREASLTILDDVSGGLDYHTDRELRHAIAENYSGNTVLISSQRVSSVQNAALIIVLEKGKIVGSGEAKYLEENCHEYKQMCQIQRAGSEVMA